MTGAPEENPDKQTTTEEKEDLHREVMRQTGTLATGALGLVAALAWNDAVRSLFERIFGTAGGGIAAKFGYAALVTVVVVVVSVRLQKTLLKK